MRIRPSILVAAVLSLAFLAPTTPGVAQEEESEQHNTRRVEALSERVHRRLSDSQDALDTDDFVTAEAKLHEILELRNLTPYEIAQTNRFLGYVHLKKEDYPPAIDAFLNVIGIGGPDVIGPLYNEIIKILSQLYMQLENYSEAIRYGLQWIDSQANPPPRDYMLLASAYYQMGQMRETVDFSTAGIEAAQATGVEVRENWWGLKLAAYWELEQYNEALEVSKILVTQWPKRSYWLQLGGLYASLDDETRQRAAYWSAYDQGLLTSSQEITATGQLLLLAGVPYKAAVILQEGVDEGSIDPTASNYRILAQAWQMAQEHDRALEPLRKAAENEDDADDKSTLYVRLAETNFALSDYEQCVSAARDAIRQNSSKNEGPAYLLLGQCLFEQDQFDEADNALSRAARDDSTRRRATRLRNYFNNEVARRRDLEDRLRRYAD